MQSIVNEFILLQQVNNISDIIMLEKQSHQKTDWDEWDFQILRDVKAGKFDNLAKKAIQEYEDGLTEEL